MNNNVLTIEEKRAWLAKIFRDTSGEYTDADKFKAMIADTSLAMLTPNRQGNLDSSTVSGILHCPMKIYQVDERTNTRIDITSDCHEITASSQPEDDYWENPKICVTCIHYKQNRCNLTAFHFSPEHPTCSRYIPKTK